MTPDPDKPTFELLVDISPNKGWLTPHFILIQSKIMLSSFCQVAATNSDLTQSTNYSDDNPGAEEPLSTATGEHFSTAIGGVEATTAATEVGGVTGASTAALEHPPQQQQWRPPLFPR